MSEGKQCLKCGHTRTEDDPPPSSQCPECGAIYAKVEAHKVAQMATARAGKARSPAGRIKRIAMYSAALLMFAIGMELISQLEPDTVQPPAPAPEVTRSAPALPTAKKPSPPSIPDINKTLRNVEYSATHATGDAETICTDTWTKRGVLDKRMYDHCMSGQREAMKNLEFLISENSTSRYYDISLLHCKSKWTDRSVVNPRMMNHCLEQEIEGWKDIEYYKTIYDRGRIEALAHEGMLRYRSWNMAAYHMKKIIDQ